ncbi:MAG: hypothetical protein H6759_03605 [Candidatus Nomurabacteria bacterium]|nr:MAG: hypothetical protein H6759_03605 [Candidatus Nomurabacteria bacterium]
MITNMRSALLWAGLISTLFIFTLGCGDGIDHIVDGGPCQNTPWVCPDDSGMGGDNSIDGGDVGNCTPVAEDTFSCLTGVDNDCDQLTGVNDTDCDAPMCHPGGAYGPDILDGIHGNTMDYCFDFSWSNDLTTDMSGTMAQVLNRPQMFTCCRVSDGFCPARSLSYSSPIEPGLEPGVEWNDQTDCPLGAEVGPNGERLLVNRVCGVFTRLLDSGLIERGTISGDARTVTDNCQ